MNIESLQSRKQELEQALINTQQSYHILTGHLHEVDYQIKKLNECESNSDLDSNESTE